MAKISTDVNIDNIIKILEILRENHDSLISMKDSLSQNMYDTALAEGKRSFFDTVAHLVFSEISFTQQVVMALSEENPEVAKIHPKKNYAKALNIEKLTMDELITYYKLNRKINLETFHSLDMKRWNAEFSESGKKKSQNVFLACRAYAAHERKHLKQLQTRIRNYGKEEEE